MNNETNNPSSVKKFSIVISTVILVIALGIAGAIVLYQQQPSDNSSVEENVTEEADQLYTKALDVLKAGKTSEAIAQFELALAAYEKDDNQDGAELSRQQIEQAKQEMLKENQQAGPYEAPVDETEIIRQN